MFGLQKWIKKVKGESAIDDEDIEPTTQKCGIPKIAEANETVANYLSKVFYENAYAEYCGGTLFVTRQLVNKIGKLIRGGEEFYFLNVNDEELDSNVRYWVCMCYLKYKTKTAHFYESALQYVQENVDTSELAKRILEFV